MRRRRGSGRCGCGGAGSGWRGGGTDAGDGCDAACAIEDGWDCAGVPSACAGICGDGLVHGDEACDDGNGDDGDGCDVTCVIEDSFLCTGEPSVCSPAARCGDGVLDDGEACDDENGLDGDGCDAACAIEPDHTCVGEPSACVPDRDGDGVTDQDDNCPDDANPDQLDTDADGAGDACDPIEETDAGCCSTSNDGDSLAGLAVLALISVAGLRRRRLRGNVKERPDRGRFARRRALM